MLNYRFPATGSGLVERDVWGLLQLMSAPEDVRKLLLEAKEAEKSTRSALAELAAEQQRAEQRRADNAAKEAELVAMEQRLADAKAQSEREIASARTQLSQDRKRIEQDREDLRERISRHGAAERDLAELVKQMDNRESVLAAQESDLAARKANLAEVVGLFEAKGLSSK